MTQWPSAGMKCVCIKKIPYQIINPGPTVYTVDKVFMLTNLHITFVGIRNGGELAECFAPLVSKTESEDLAVFRRIADLAGVDEALRRLEGVE